MLKEDYDVLNEILDLLIERYDTFDEEVFSFESKMASIVLMNNPNKKDSFKTSKNKLNNRRKVAIARNINFVEECLKECFPKKYYEMFRNAIDEGDFHFEEDDGTSSYYTEEYGQNVLRIATRHSIEDAFTIMHEFMHFTNFRNNIRTYASEIYTEAISFFSEQVLADYIIKSYPQYKSEIVDMFDRENNIFNEMALLCKIISELIKRKMNGEWINYKTTQDIIKDLYYLPKDKVDLYIRIVIGVAFGIDEIFEYDDLYPLFTVSSRYSIAAPISKYLYEMYKESPEEAIDFNDAILLEGKTPEAPYNYLNLDSKILFYGERTKKEIIDNFIGETLSSTIVDEDFNKIEKVYKKNIKRF